MDLSAAWQGSLDRSGALMPRWVWFVPVALLAVLGGLHAFRLGWIVAHVTETVVIERYAAAYLASGREGPRASDCFAIPGEGAGVWIVVRCAPEGGPAVSYFVNRFGALERVETGPVVEPGA